MRQVRLRSGVAVQILLSPGPRSWQFTIWTIIVTDREKATALSYALPSPGGLCFEIVTGTALLRWRLTFGSVAGA